jgi:hypothetical protein
MKIRMRTSLGASSAGVPPSQEKTPGWLYRTTRRSENHLWMPNDRFAVVCPDGPIPFEGRTSW